MLGATTYAKANSSEVRRPTPPKDDLWDSMSEEEYAECLLIMQDASDSDDWFGIDDIGSLL